MKTRAYFLAILLFFCTAVVQAQSSKRSIDDKVENVMKKFDALKLEKSTYNTVTDIFTDFYTSQDKIRDNIQKPASSLAQGLARQDYQSVRKQNEKIIEDRDQRLKKALTADQYKKWIDDIEPSLHSRR